MQRRNILAHITFGETQRGGCRRRRAPGQFLTQPGGIAVATRMSGTMPQHARSHIPLWLAPSGLVTPGPVEHDRDRQPVQRDVHHHLSKARLRKVE